MLSVFYYVIINKYKYFVPLLHVVINLNTFFVILSLVLF